MDGLAEIVRTNEADHGFVGTVKIPNERTRRVIIETCQRIADKSVYVQAYRDNPQRADDYAFGHVCGVFQVLRESGDRATAGFAELMLAQAERGGVAFVKELLTKVTGQE